MKPKMQTITMKTRVLMALSFMCALLAAIFPTLAVAGEIIAGSTGEGGAVFEPVYDFFYGAATGYLGRAISIVGGLVGLGYGAIQGKAIIALLGVLLAFFGVFGPFLIDSLFTSALI